MLKEGFISVLKMTAELSASRSANQRLKIFPNQYPTTLIPKSTRTLKSRVKEHINWRADLSGSRRIEIPEIPVRSIKEAIINSLCHRDFANPKSNEIAIYRDRIEIFNPGQFPYEYSPEDFIKGNKPSIPRNPLIAETLYRSEDIEKWGSGLRRISEECKATGVKVAFEKIKSGFVVTFYRPGIIQGQARSLATETAPEGKSRQLGVSEEKIRRKYGENTEKIILAIADNQFVKTHEIANIAKLSQSTVEKVVAKLKKAGILKRIGPDKGGHWEIVGKKSEK